MAKKMHMGGPPLDKIWLQQQFDKLHKEHALILSKFECGNLSPELERAIITTAVLCKILDAKVPDRPPPVPPISNPKP